jgi:hypothetical protein
MNCFVDLMRARSTIVAANSSEQNVHHAIGRTSWSAAVNNELETIGGKGRLAKVNHVVSQP